MFVCTKCGKADSFEFMVNPYYKSPEKIKSSVDKKGNLSITADGHTFTPDLNFMNNYAVCSFCGSIYCWDYSKRGEK
ncbi:MAG: hypothetical protein K6C94_08510 [Candidatus Gastranaerophilales bacterium]|nr:hypothetical protein [Candidatus Gastranaerophilales bacterium]